MLRCPAFSHQVQALVHIKACPRIAASRLVTEFLLEGITAKNGKDGGARRQAWGEGAWPRASQAGVGAHRS